MQGNLLRKRLILDKNLLSTKYFHKMLYHQTSTNQTKIDELKNIQCYRYGLMKPSIGIIKMANLRTIFGYLFEEFELTGNAKSSMQVSP